MRDDVVECGPRAVNIHRKAKRAANKKKGGYIDVEEVENSKKLGPVNSERCPAYCSFNYTERTKNKK